MHGDLGISLKAESPWDEFVPRPLKATLKSWRLRHDFAVAVGIPVVGVLAAVKRGSIRSHCCWPALTGYSILPFWWGMMLIGAGLRPLEPGRRFPGAWDIWFLMIPIR
ncbi:hypothetical protein KCP70_10135 [Salmonella enterica subsp. enterica]|nr:hypothetical protein KCP70_10135 [Salmonella enterica subsp. enterica]